MDNSPHTKNLEVCPPGLAWLLVNPLRRLLHDPDKILGGLGLEGLAVADLGCGPGYFSIPMGRLSGENGRVFAVDMEEEMLGMVRRRAAAAGLAARIQTVLCSPREIGLEDGSVDFALACWMVHEVADQEGFLRQVFKLLKPGGRFLLVEPIIHVSGADFNETSGMAIAAGFELLSRPKVSISHAALFGRGVALQL